MGLFGNSDAALEKQIFNLKFTSKQLARMQVKCQKAEKAELLKVKKSIEKGDMEIGRIYGQNAIRLKGEGNGYLKLASRMDAVASRLESAVKMKQVTKQMGTVVTGMDKVLGSMDVGKISSVMDKFEQSFDRLDAQSAMIDGTLNSATASSMPEDAVEQLMSQVADEHGLAFAAATPAAGTSAVRPEAATTGMEEVEHSLEKRLAALRG